MDDGSELQLLRSRLMTSLLEERRRIERALHDGVQQDLIALSVQLQLVRDLVETAPAEALASLDELEQQTRSTLDRVRTLAVEIYPAILDSRGLPDALHQAARASAAAARVEIAEVGRYPVEIEAAVFFLWRGVLDGLGAGTEARIRARERDESLQVEIDFEGAVDFTRANDLVEAAGGILKVDAEPGGGHARVRFPRA
jgi:signal transduction histidine kinase